MIASQVVKELKDVVGDRFASVDSEITYLYHYDFITAEPEGKCDLAIMPNSAEEVQKIVQIANKHKIPIIPWVSGINFGGVGNPYKGGIVMDLRRMNRILEVNEDDMYALIEAGVTWADLKGYLQKNHPDLRPGVTWSPPGTGVVPSCLCYGMFDMGNLGGSGAEFVNGMQVVLGTGELVKFGSCSASNQWYGRMPFPDLSGLLIGADGTVGCVTKMSVKLWPMMPYRRDYVAITQKMDVGVPVMNKLARIGIGINDIILVNHGWLQSTVGDNEKNMPIDPLKANPPIPDFYGSIKIQAYTEKQHEAQCEALESICKEKGLMIMPASERETPVQVWGCWNFARGGGGEWIGSYCSTKDIVDYYNISREICIKYNRPPQFYSRIMFGGHYSVARTNLNFNKNDPKDIETARKALKEIYTEVHKIDGVAMYKTPRWANKSHEERMLPATSNLIKKIKKLLDPNNIFNPGRIGVD